MAPHKLPVDMRREQSAASDTSLSELSAGPTYYRQRRVERKLICYISTSRDQSGPLTWIVSSLHDEIKCEDLVTILNSDILYSPHIDKSLSSLSRKRGNLQRRHMVSGGLQIEDITLSPSRVPLRG